MNGPTFNLLELLCRDLGQYLRMQLKNHLLLLVGCYLNPLIREIEFVADPVACLNLRMKAEEMTRKLARG